MKNSMFKVVASLACAAILAACGGDGYKSDTEAVVLPPQPVFTKTDGATGTGTVTAAAGDVVTVHYTGFLYDETKSDKKGAQFETSIGGSPLALNLGFGTARLTGWDQGLVGMKVGAKRTLLIPASMAFGAGGMAKDGKTLVPANTAVVYDMEMISITTLPVPPKPVQPTFTKTDTLVGTGIEATSGKTVKVHYTGWLYDATKADFKGTQFDTSRGKNDGFEFVLGAGKVITGWDQGVPGMKVGGKRNLIIPPDMGYGASGSGSIPPNAALIFEVEMLSVK